MNRIEFKESKEYKDAVEKIKSYPKRFKFTLPYYKMTKGQKNAMHIITDDCIKKKIIDSVSFGFIIWRMERYWKYLKCKCL